MAKEKYIQVRIEMIPTYRDLNQVISDDHFATECIISKQDSTYIREEVLIPYLEFKGRNVLDGVTLREILEHVDIDMLRLKHQGESSLS